MCYFWFRCWQFIKFVIGQFICSTFRQHSSSKNSNWFKCVLRCACVHVWHCDWLALVQVSSSAAVNVRPAKAGLFGIFTLLLSCECLCVRESSKINVTICHLQGARLSRRRIAERTDWRHLHVMRQLTLLICWTTTVKRLLFVNHHHQHSWYPVSLLFLCLGWKLAPL